MVRRRKQGDTDEENVNAVARKDEYARDGDKKAPERLVEEEKTGEGWDKRLGKYDDKQKQEAEERGQEDGNDLGVEDSVAAPERLVEGDRAEKAPQGEQKGAVEDEDGMVEEGGVGEHDDTTDGGETELEEGKEEEEDEDATDVELEMGEEERGTGGGGKGTEEHKGLPDVEGEVKEHVMSGDDSIDGGEGDTAQERATKKRKSREENDDLDDDEKGKDYDEKEKDDNQEVKDYDQEVKDYDQEGKDYDEEEEEDDDDEEEDDEEVDIDAMIKLASSAVKGQISEPAEGSSGASVAGEKRPASTAAADGKIRPRKIRRGGAIMALDSKLSSPKGLLNAESKKKKKSLPVSG